MSWGLVHYEPRWVAGVARLRAEERELGLGGANNTACNIAAIATTMFPLGPQDLGGVRTTMSPPLTVIENVPPFPAGPVDTDNILEILRVSKYPLIPIGIQVLQVLPSLFGLHHRYLVMYPGRLCRDGGYHEDKR